MHLVLFDIDGTLIRGPGVGRLALERAFAEVFDRTVADYPGVADVFIAGSTDQVIMADMAGALQIQPETFQLEYPQYEAAYLRHLKRTVSESTGYAVCPGVVGALEQLHRHAQIHLALLTGNIEPGARIKLARADLNRFFETGGFGNDAPDRGDMARLAWERAGDQNGGAIPPEQVMVVGDTVFDVTAARRHGFRAVGVATGWEPRETLEAAGADRVFTDLTPENGFPSWVEAEWGLSLG